VLAAAPAATPGFWDWAFDPPLVLVIDLAIFYVVGARRTYTPERKRTAQRWRCGCFWASLAILAIALASPIERLSADLFWVHMIQHVLLIAVAAPLFVLGAPWIRLWRVLPLETRRWIAGGLSHGEGAAPLRAVSRALGKPAASFVAFSVVLLGWHTPALFNATLESNTLHAFEHTLFFFTAVLFWKQVIPSAPLRIRLSAPQRVVYLIGGMIVSWALAVVLALAPHPLYSYYAELSSRPGGISAMADQQLAAGVMWVPGSVTFLIVLFVYVHRWLVPQNPGQTRAARLASEH
jgi:cytochrome c oxidase assembly factor CtaG